MIFAPIQNQTSFSRDVHDVAFLTGIEESRIRFYQRIFEDMLPPEGFDLQNRGFTEAQVALLRRIHELMALQNLGADDVRRTLAPPVPTARVIAVTSGKGGVGKTTLSVNLAIALALRGERTLLFDADLGLANVHVLAGVTPRGTLADVAEGRARLEDVAADGPAGVKIICGASGRALLADPSSDLMDLLTRELRRVGAGFDAMLIDTGAGISSDVLRFLAVADDVVVVATPDLASTLDAYSVVKACLQTGAAGRLHVLVNQVRDPAAAAAVYEKIGGCAERFLGSRPAYLGCLLSHHLVNESNQCRQPVVVAHPRCRSAQDIREIAARLAVGHTPKGGGHPWTRHV